MKLKLRTRFLIVTWGVLALVTLGASVSWFLTNDVNESLSIALGRRLKQVEIYEKITELVDVNYIQIVLAITQKTPDEAKLVETKTKETSVELTALYKELESIILSQQAKDNFAKVLEARKAYVKLRSEALTSHINMDPDSARKELLAAEEKRLVYVAAIKNAQLYTQKLMQQSKEEAFQKMKSLTYINGGVSVLLLGIIFVSFWNIGRTLTKTLGEDPSLLSAKVKHIESGDFRWEQKTYPEGSIGDSVQNLVSMLQRSLSSIKQGSVQVSAATAEIAMGNQDLSARTEKMAANLEEVSSSMQSVTQLVHTSANDARTASQLAEQANQKAILGKDVMTDVSTGMNRITASSKKIADIVGVIDGIAFQTNILALNAAVEAARAGEQGRGFAVVAAEVRALSQRSSSAAKEIKDLITQSVQDIDMGANSVQKAVESIEGINADIMETSARMKSIVVAAQEQSDSFEQINAAITQLDEVTQQNAALVEETASASDSVRSQAMEMAKETEHFQF